MVEFDARTNTARITASVEILPITLWGILGVEFCSIPEHVQEALRRRIEKGKMEVKILSAARDALDLPTIRGDTALELRFEFVIAGDYAHFAKDE